MLPPLPSLQQGAVSAPYLLLEETGAGYIATEGGHDVFYDEAAGLLHIVEGRMVSAIALPGRNLPGSSSTPAGVGALSPTPSSLFASLSTPERQQQHEEEKEEDASPSPLPELPAAEPPASFHQRTASDAISVASTATTTTPSRAFLVSSGPKITAVCSSLDGNFTALQRSELQIEFLDHSTGNMFIETPHQNSRSAGALLLGFFFTDAPNAEFVLVTSMGLELYSPIVGSQGLKHTAFQRLSAVQWFTWSYSTGILLAGCGTSGAKLQAFQFSRTNHATGGVVRLPMLDLTPPWGSPMKASPRKSQSGQSYHAASRAAPWLLVSPTQVWVVLLYRRVFVAYHDLSSNTLKLYRMYHNGTALFAECPLTISSATGSGGGYVAGPEQIELSVVDDIIVVHLTQQQQQQQQHSTSSGGDSGDSGGSSGGTAVLIDITAEGVPGPAGIRIIDPIISTPTQLGVVLLDDDVIKEEQDEKEEEEEEQHQRAVEEQNHVQKLSLFYPDIAVDQSTGRIFRLQIDLVALSEACFSSSSSFAAARRRDLPSLLAFLRRRQERTSNSEQRRYTVQRDPRHVILRVLRRIINERAAPALLRAAFDAVLAPSPSSLRRHQQTSSRKKNNNEDDDDAYRVVHAKEIALGILASALQVASPRPSAAATTTTTASKTTATAAAEYVTAALSELLASCYATNNYPVNADIASLYVTAYSYAEKEYLLPLLLKSHAQLLDSPEFAERLAAGEVLLLDPGSSPDNNKKKNQLLQEVALDMWKRLGNHTQVCKLLLQQESTVQQAIRHAQQHEVSSMAEEEDPESIFNAALNALNNSATNEGTYSEGEGDTTVLKSALKRVLQDQKTKFSHHSRFSSTRGQHPRSSMSSSSSSVDALAGHSSEFLDQQTVSLVEALENF